MLENYELVQKGFRILHPLMAGYIGREFSRVYKDGWWQEVLDALSAQHDLPESGDYGELIDSLDVMTIVTEICDEFDVEILPTDVVPENFESVEAMWQLIMRLQED